MANDKGDGEDLFEDLDKFFAPIRDVDWDEPEESTERGTAGVPRGGAFGGGP